MGLITEPNFRRGDDRGLWPYSAGDDFYQMLIDAHRDLDDAASQMLNSKLILLLANHIGELGIIREAIAHAAQDVVPAKPGG